MPLFEGTPDEKEERLLEAERLGELEARRTELMGELLDIAAEQAERVRLIRKGEKEMRRLLEDVPEHIVPEGQPLTHEDVVKWTQTVHKQFARTMPYNPHFYIHRRWCDDGMYERVLRHVIEHGYDSRYGGHTYRTYDAGDCFYWWMGKPPEESILLNGKPISMKPE